MRCFTLKETRFEEGIEAHIHKFELTHFNVDILFTESKFTGQKTCRIQNVRLDWNDIEKRYMLLDFDREIENDHSVLVAIPEEYNPKLRLYTLVGDYYFRCRGKNIFSKFLTPYGKGVTLVNNDIYKETNLLNIKRFANQTPSLLVAMEPDTVIELESRDNGKKIYQFVYYDGSALKLLCPSGLPNCNMAV